MTRERKRKSRVQSRTIAGIQQQPWKQPRNLYSPFEIASADQIEALHQSSLRILAELGIAFLDDEALDILKEHGAEVNRSTKMVKFSPELIEKYIAKAPSKFTLHARNPQHNLEIGENWTLYSMVGSTPNCSDLDHGRRPGNFTDYQNLIRLAQHFNVIHMTGGYPLEPIDLPANTRHLDCAFTHLTLTDKVFHAYSPEIGRASCRERV